ncbi:MAG: GDSL-type esterase/lipase family protein [Methylocystaceae bacterium]
MSTIICLGDSLTWGYPYGPEVSWVNLIPELYNLEAINRGINGNTTGEMLERFDRHVLQKKPKYVIITGGANDVFWRESVDAIIYNYQQMLQQAEQSGIKVIIGLTPPVDDPEMEARLKMVRTRLLELAQIKELQVIDFTPPFYEADGSVNGKLFLDGAHPSRQGYLLMGKCLPTKIA